MDSKKMMEKSSMEDVFIELIKSDEMKKVIEDMIKNKDSKLDMIKKEMKCIMNKMEGEHDDEKDEEGVEEEESSREPYSENPKVDTRITGYIIARAKTEV